MANQELLYHDPYAQQTPDGPLLSMLKEHITKTSENFEKALKSNRYHMRQMIVKETPTVVPVMGYNPAGSISVDGDLVLDLGGPQLGRKWDIRLLRISSSLHVNTAVEDTDIANFYIGMPHAYSPVNWVWNFTNTASTALEIPGVKNFTSNSLTVTPNDHLFCVYTSGTAGNPVLASALILDYPVVANAGAGFEVI